MFKAIKEFFLGKPKVETTSVPVPYKTEAPSAELVNEAPAIVVKPELKVVQGSAPAKKTRAPAKAKTSTAKTAKSAKPKTEATPRKPRATKTTK